MILALLIIGYLALGVPGIIVIWTKDDEVIVGQLILMFISLIFGPISFFVTIIGLLDKHTGTVVFKRKPKQLKVPALQVSNCEPARPKAGQWMNGN